MMRSCYLCCGGGGSAGSKTLQACVAMAFLISPSTAFLPAISSAVIVRHIRRTASASSISASHRKREATITASQRSLVSLSAAGTDGAKDAAVRAVQAADEALNKAAHDAGSAASRDEVQATVAAARAAARSAMESLRRDPGTFGGGGLGDEAVQQDEVTSQARSAVKAALSAVAEAQAAAPAAATASSTAAQDAIGMVQAALDRRDSATVELGAESSEDTPVAAETAVLTSRGDGSVSDGGEEGGDGTKEPESARWSRNNPAASHSHMAHLLWRQVAGPGDTVLDCTAGNGHDSLELAKIVALKDGVGSLYVMDVQERAIEATRERLRSELGELALKRSTLINGNFREMPAELEPLSVQLVVYNLGWLPGGDKSITTKLEDTLESIEAAKRVVKHGGMISVMLYRGHAEGKRETEAVRDYAAGLAHSQWRVFMHERINRADSPELLTIFKL
ncbi:methylase-related [Ectocarpus siliculosus]|uniref:Methylase-related n=1 Tax=Ectocarpus siliculosus TaxID=2880 RepID=D8LAV3_ECTSI|nr:methylase-related [Ectocarpus siliculosus]|eukprot:CBN76462.1 methylase-related [Ectocarpus siliculosus]